MQILKKSTFVILWCKRFSGAYLEVDMYFKRKAYDKLLEWKDLYSDKYAVLLEGLDELANQQ